MKYARRRFKPTDADRAEIQHKMYKFTFVKQAMYTILMLAQ